MKLIRMFCQLSLLSLIFIHYLYAYDIAVPSIKKDDQINSLTNLISNCYPDVKARIVIVDSLTKPRSEDLYKKSTGSVTLLENSTNYRIPLNQIVPVPLVILSLTSPTKVNEVLANETWRVFNQFFIILDGNSDSGCINAQSFLMEAWKNDVLNVVFMCSDHQDPVPKIYSFNPFTDFALMPWRKVSVVPAINNHSWTLFTQSYSIDDAVCRSLFFDKTDNLGGYSIKIGAQYVMPYIAYSVNNGVKRLEGFDYEIVKLLISKLNMSVAFEERDTKILKHFKTAITQYLLWQLGNKTIDFAVNSLILTDRFEKVEKTYPFYQTGFSVITQRRELKKIAKHLFSFLPFHIIAILFIVSIVIFFLLRYLLQDPYSRNLIDILRVFLNLPLPRVPSTIRGRIVFGITLMSFTVVNIVIQSNMNTVLTSSNTARNVENLNDLMELRYLIYTRGFIKSYMDNAGVTTLEPVFEVRNCSQLKKQEAYLSKEISLQPLMTVNCHMPRKPIISGRFLVYSARHNWPIFPQLNKKLLMLFEGGLTDYHIKKALDKYQQIKQKPDQYQVITMDHMKITFYGFIVLNLISIVVFGIELFILRLSNSLNTVFDHFI